MRSATRRTAEGLAVAGGVIAVLRAGTRANRDARHHAEALARRARHAAGRLHGISYRLRGHEPDPEVAGNVLADRIRSSLGPLEKRLDLPRIHVLVEDHVALLHGEVGDGSEAEALEAAVGAVSGVRGVESYLHIGLVGGDTRPSAGRAAERASAAQHRLVEAATSAGVDPTVAPSVVRAILATFAERIPHGERAHVAAHLPADVRSMFEPPRRLCTLAPARTTAELVARIAGTTEALPEDRAVEVTRAVVRELAALVPDEGADVAATLPADLRDLWAPAVTAPPRRSGTVIWVDLSTTDLDRSIRFYEALFGWRSHRTETGLGTYVVARIDAGEVGGMMAQPPDDSAAGVPSSWTVVVGSDDLEPALARAVELGGSVLQPPTPIPGDARIAIIADPSGAVLALMESPQSEHGMAWGETAAASWVECLSRDPGNSRGFYEDLFGWQDEEGTGGYVVFHLDGERVGGLMAMPATVPGEVPSYWLVHFAVTDAQATCELAAARGGTVLEPVHDIDEGRFAVLADPAGAVFAVFESRSG